LNIDRFRKPSKFLVYLLVMLHVLTGCATTSGSGTNVGPRASSSFSEDMSKTAYSGPKMDVVIPVFSPGLSDKAANYEKEGVWPELRRAEANRFAYKLKKALDDTGKFGAVRVTPDKTASGDLYVLGKIVESNGLEVEFDMDVIDASGKQWLDDNIDYEVGDGFYKNPRNTDKDPYDPAFDKAAADIVKALLKQKPSDLSTVKHIADLRFGASFNDKAFDEYMDTSSTPIKLKGMPSEADPLYERVKEIRVKEQLFVDNLQPNYAAFSQKMDDSYLTWQKASATELKLQQEAQNKSLMKIIGGALLIAAAVAVGSNGSRYDNNLGRDMVTIAGGIGGAVLITSGITSREEAKFHQDAINELGQSLDLEMSPQVVEFENQSTKLTGNMEQQFQQWRAFMARMYELESTPDKAL
jgi:hypothetical protein